MGSKDKYNTGFALIEKGKEKFDLDLNQILINKNILVEEKENFLDCEVEGEKTYYLIPFTDKPFLLGRFEIKIYSDEVIEIKEFKIKNHYSYYENEMKLIDENSLKNILCLFPNKIQKKPNINSHFLLNFNISTSHQIMLLMKKNSRNYTKISIIQIKEKKHYEILTEKEEDQTNEIKLK